MYVPLHTRGGALSAGRVTDRSEPKEMPPYIAPEANAIVGFWGRATSTLDWCEENYITSFYIAEFCETTTTSSADVCVCVRMHACIDQ